MSSATGAPSAVSLEPALDTRSRLGGVRGFWLRIPRVLRQPVAIVSLGILLVLVLTAVFADLVGWRDPTTQFRRLELTPPLTMAPDGAPLLLGGDELGRDLFSRVVHGARISIFVSVAATVGAVVLGTLAGLIAGYFGGVADGILQRLVDIFMAMPVIILAMVIASVLNAGIYGVILAIVIIYWPRIARVVRGDVMLVKSFGYVESARAVGCQHARILRLHILPNVTSSIIVMATTTMGAAILVEAALAFLAIGAKPPTPSWGLMIAEARSYLTRDPMLLIAPGLPLSLVVLALNLGGDVLRDLLDPRMRGTT